MQLMAGSVPSTFGNYNTIAFTIAMLSSCHCSINRLIDRWITCLPFGIVTSFADLLINKAVRYISFHFQSTHLSPSDEILRYIWSALFQNAISAIPTIEPVMLMLSLGIVVCKRTLHSCMSIYIYIIWRGIFRNPIYKLGIGISNPFLGMALIVFCAYHLSRLEYFLCNLLFIQSIWLAWMDILYY